ncbi:MAG TPA: maleylpyruvate isomerase family mycothiol-dependent enzyme [Acidimicrobiia bacterium]|nr:maleylpyruvate isomerase family mycothiol-dependent enzyme [Acidimicrobiia bacterium]
MSDRDHELVDILDEVWTSIETFAEDLREDEWKRSTELPGWTVQDNLVHISAVESMSLGRPWRDHEASNLSHVRNEVGTSNEHAVDSRRTWSGTEALAEFHVLTRERLAGLRALDEDGFGADSWTPVGPGTVRDLLPFRVFDSWVHEQDMRRAVQQPGDLDSRAAQLTHAMIADAMPYVVGKKVAPPEGSTVVFSVTGVVPRDLALQIVGGRAAKVEGVAEPTVRLTMDGVTFERVACGRVAPRAALAAHEVRIDGDAALGRRVLDEMNYLF